jgi:hypothetical protein
VAANIAYFCRSLLFFDPDGRHRELRGSSKSWHMGNMTLTGVEYTTEQGRKRRIEGGQFGGGARGQIGPSGGEVGASSRMHLCK